MEEIDTSSGHPGAQWVWSPESEEQEGEVPQEILVDEEQQPEGSWYGGVSNNPLRGPSLVASLRRSYSATETSALIRAGVGFSGTYNAADRLVPSSQTGARGLVEVKSLMSFQDLVDSKGSPPRPAHPAPRVSSVTSLADSTLGLERQHLSKDSIQARPVRRWLYRAVGNLAAGVVAFLLTVSISVSGGSIVFGHQPELKGHMASAVSLNIFGTIFLNIFLAQTSTAPWVLGAVDIFIFPVLAEMMGALIRAVDEERKLLPTAILSICLTVAVLGLALLALGKSRYSSFSNYLPYPVIAGFLSGIGALLVSHGLRMSSNRRSPLFAIDNLSHLAIGIGLGLTLHFGAKRVPMSLLFPRSVNAFLAKFMFLGYRGGADLTFGLCQALLLLSLMAFHGLRCALGYSIGAMQETMWLFDWPEEMMDSTRLWHPWVHLDLGEIQTYGYTASVVVLGALKNTVFVGALATLFKRDIDPNRELVAIGLGNLLSAACGGTGGCHYLSAMGLMARMGADTWAPAMICAGLNLCLWVLGLRLLLFIPRFVFGGLLLSIGLHFLQDYLVQPARLFPRSDLTVVLVIVVSFMLVVTVTTPQPQVLRLTLATVILSLLAFAIGMLQSVGLGILFSLVQLVLRVQYIGCIRYESTLLNHRSNVDRDKSQERVLERFGEQVLILRLHGYFFFALAFSLIDKVKTRLEATQLRKLLVLVIDFALVPAFDSTAMANLSKLVALADSHRFCVIFSSLSPPLEKSWRRHPVSKHQRIQYKSNLDEALEVAEELILHRHAHTMARGKVGPGPSFKAAVSERATALVSQLQSHVGGSPSVVELWNLYLDEVFGKEERSRAVLLPLAVHLNAFSLQAKQALFNEGDVSDRIYFVCSGFVDIMSYMVQRGDRGFTKTDNPVNSGAVDKQDRSVFRVRKAGPGSIIGAEGIFHSKHHRVHCAIATTHCTALQLRVEILQELERDAPQISLQLYRLLFRKLTKRYFQTQQNLAQLNTVFNSRADFEPL